MFIRTGVRLGGYSPLTEADCWGLGYIPIAKTTKNRMTMVRTMPMMGKSPPGTKPTTYPNRNHPPDEQAREPELLLCRGRYVLVNGVGDSPT